MVPQRFKRMVRTILEKLRLQRSTLYGDSFWYEAPNLWEPPVQIALRDLCRPGAVVYDVGANFGGLTSIMSRLVGPRGIVCSFEASPRIFEHLQANIVKQGHGNATAYHCAVYSRSNQRVKIYPGDHMNDSLYHHGHGQPGEFQMVNTVALDDFSSRTGLVPSLIKMDIEGAEFDALQGAAGLIGAHKPHLILEQATGDTRCLDLLRSKGYAVLDLNSYTPVASVSDFPAGVSLRNLLFVHASRVAELPYALPPATEPVQEMHAVDFLRAGNSFKLAAPLRLAPGRYLADMQFLASGMSNELMCGVKVDGQVVFRYHAYSKLLAENYRDWVFDVVGDASVELYFDFINGSFDDSFRLSGAALRRLSSFVPDARTRFALP
jgi:FkbM family methyltransferase